MTQYDYDVAISFAGEQREEAASIADCLKQHGIKVFLDTYEKSDLWGKNLFDHLTEIYQSKAEYCIILCSKEYVSKAWPTHERQVAQARALENKGKDYILPVQFDRTPLPGMYTVGYLDYKIEGPPGVCRAFLAKTGRSSAETSIVSPHVTALLRGKYQRFTWLALILAFIILAVIASSQLLEKLTRDPQKLRPAPFRLQPPPDSTSSDSRSTTSDNPLTPKEFKSQAATSKPSKANESTSKFAKSSVDESTTGPREAQSAQNADVPMSSDEHLQRQPNRPEIKRRPGNEADLPPLTIVPRDDRPPFQRTVAGALGVSPAHSWFDKKNYEYALANMNRLIEGSNPSVRDYNNRGVIYAAMRQYPKAVADFRRAGAGGNIAKVYFLTGDYQAALQTLNQLLAQAPENWVMLRWRGDVRKKLGDLSGAVDDYRLAEQLSGSPIRTISSMDYPLCNWED